MPSCEYLNSHFSCPKFNNPEHALFTLHYASKGQSHSYVDIRISTIVFILEGGLEYSFDKHFRKRISSGQFLLIPAGVTVSVSILENTRSIRCRLDMQLQICEYFRIDMLKSIFSQDGKYPHQLEIKPVISFYLDSVRNYLQGGFMCSCMGLHKQQELMCLLRAIYTQKELVGFFSPVLNKDIHFMDAVRRNYPGAVTVSELARRVNYSVSGFNKRFERCFGQSAHSWMQQQRSECILRDLRENLLSNKEIRYRYNFSSDARFYEFCRSKWGKTPGEIRRNGLQQEVAPSA